MTKRILSFFLTVLTLFSLSVLALAADEPTVTEESAVTE